jgi:hypothetical protein
MGFYFLFLATGTAVYRDQPALLYVELLRRIYHPFMMAIATQGIALVLFFQGRFTKRDNLSHDEMACRYSRVRCTAAFHDATRLRLAGADICTLNSRSACQIFLTAVGLDHSPTPKPAR